MLDVANKYEKELQSLFMDIWYNDKYKFYFAEPYGDIYKTSENNWNSHNFISINKDKKILGYMTYSIDRGDYSAYAMKIINFSDDMITFGKDLNEFLHNIFAKFKFRKLSFCVVVGNPIEKSYDKMIDKYGGRIVGIKKKHTRLIDGEYYDIKLYEIFKEDYERATKNG